VGKRRFAAAVGAELRADERVELATAEEPLGLPAERAYRLRPLAEAPAVELFGQRAEVAAPGFDAPYAEVARVCRRVGRLPLAIELAAARAPAALAELGDHPSALSDVIAWTCYRLSAREREVLRAVAADPAAVELGLVADEIAALEALNLVERSGAGVATHSAIRPIAASL
jgi:hypothetical protein